MSEPAEGQSWVHLGVVSQWPVVSPSLRFGHAFQEGTDGATQGTTGDTSPPEYVDTFLVRGDHTMNVLIDAIDPDGKGQSLEDDMRWQRTTYRIVRVLPVWPIVTLNGGDPIPSYHGVVSALNDALYAAPGIQDPVIVERKMLLLLHAQYYLRLWIDAIATQCDAQVTEKTMLSPPVVRYTVVPSNIHSWCSLSAEIESNATTPRRKTASVTVSIMVPLQTGAAPDMWSTITSASATLAYSMWQQIARTSATETTQANANVGNEAIVTVELNVR